MASACIKWLALAVSSAGLTALTACTTVGTNTAERLKVDYGPPITLRVCILQAPGVTPENVASLIGAVNTEFAPYGISVVVPWQRPWARPGFTHTTLLDDVMHRELESPCDRLVALVDRNAGDALWGLVMPEILGEVEGTTHTHGYVVATMASVNQILAPPSAATVHEFYHLLGCPHALSLSRCYHLIAELKKQTPADGSFVPGIDDQGAFMTSRSGVNVLLRTSLALQDIAWGDHVHNTSAVYTAVCPAARAQVLNVLTADPQSYGVGLCVCIDKAGTMTQDPLVLVSSGNNSIDAGAAESLRHRASPFKPMVLDGNPVGGCFPLVLTYELPSPTATTH